MQNIEQVKLRFPKIEVCHNLFILQNVACGRAYACIHSFVSLQFKFENTILLDAW